MKKTIKLILILIFTYTSTLYAQQRGTPFTEAPQMITQFAEELNLSDDQKRALTELQLDRRAQRSQYSGRNFSGATRSQSGVRQDSQRGNQRNSGGVMRQRSEQNLQGGRSERRVGNRDSAVRVSEGEFPVRYQQRDQMQEALNEILSDEQMEKLQQLRIEQMETRNEYRELRQQVVIERAGLDPAKTGRVTALLEEMNRHRNSMQLLRIESDGLPDSEKVTTILEEIRTIQEQLRDELTVNEFRALQSAGIGGERGNRGGRSMMRNR